MRFPWPGSQGQGQGQGQTEGQGYAGRGQSFLALPDLECVDAGGELAGVQEAA